MTHWMEGDWPMQLCDRCGQPNDTDYAWCYSCQESGTCHHGNKPHECNQCMIESDIAYDSHKHSISSNPERRDESE
jgi:hypothetical protein